MNKKRRKVNDIMDNTTKQLMNKRALTSMFMFFSFILLPLSGILLHLSRASGEVGVFEHFWMSVHNMSAFIFLITVVIHLSLNWNAMMKYIAAKTSQYFQFRKEMIIALVTVIFVVGLFSSHAFLVH
jgi:hypothetical protein